MLLEEADFHRANTVQDDLRSTVANSNVKKLNTTRTPHLFKNMAYVRVSSEKYLLLTEFEVRAVSYGLSFSPLIYGPSAKRAGHKS